MHIQGWTLLLVLWLGAPWATAEVPVPPLRAHVTDFTNTLDPAQRSALEQTLSDFEAKHGAQIAVLIVPTTAPETIEQYSIRVAEQWKLGRKGIDDGVLLLVAKQDRALRIEVGYGLEGVIPDAIANRVVEDVIVPYFKRGDYVGGIQAGVQQLMHLIEGEPLPPPERGRVAGNTEANLPLLIVGALAVGLLLRAMFGRLFGGGLTGVGVGVLAWWMFGSLLFGLLVGVFAFFFLLGGGGGFFPGPGGWGSSPRGGWGGGGFGGGMSGGGGGFGGGGASGRW